MAVERMKRCENITALSEELGVARRQLYLWREQFDAIEGRSERAPTQAGVGGEDSGGGFFQGCQLGPPARERS
jgi:transposase-like protein